MRHVKNHTVYSIDKITLDYLKYLDLQHSTYATTVLPEVPHYTVVNNLLLPHHAMHVAVKTFHCLHLLASLLALLYCLLTVWRALSTLCHQFILGHPLFLLPTKIQLRACFVDLAGGAPVHSPTSRGITCRWWLTHGASWMSLTSLFDIKSFHLMLRILFSCLVLHCQISQL